jgi:hypothetical protein
MSLTHLESVPENLECAAYLIDIDESEYCEYQTSDGYWHPSPYCSEVVQMLLKNGFSDYLKAIDEATCKAHLRRLITEGPPLYLKDKTFEVPEGQHISKVWFKSEDKEIDAIYEGALQGEEREEMWNHHRAVFECLPEEENDSDPSDAKRQKVE